ncbi:MAG TPA: rhomboid family intramembrane serine protease [Bacteroidales bacterium]|nr:rhomboid family intramembrane serine protease [Bacteroidales bacterium]HSA42480.1 rhomboid family intramembrane serine protease [Bacteroidales bacterium]
MEQEPKKIIHSLLPPLLLVILMWIVKACELYFRFDLSFLGIYPLHWKGLPGIVTGIFIHGDLSHLSANSGPVIILGGVIFYFYRRIAWTILATLTLMTGLWVWVMARESWHIGASGLVYAMASFVFASGMIRRDNRLLAVSLLVVFLYGGLIWGVFPELFPEKNISWESHLMGIVAGIVAAVYFKNEGPARKKYAWEDETDDEVPDWYPDEPPAPPPPSDQTPDNQEINIRYDYKEKKGEPS